MLRKVFAFICTAITLFALKELYHIFTSSDVEIAKQRPILIIIGFSIVLPLAVLSLWLWKPKAKNVV